ncbi:hypothetical protein IG631_05542 [Alternaria alternata]|jgi:hypothetical protein|nr:hypothetical protein IG631_05542 [Alternaria alternata]
MCLELRQEALRELIKLSIPYIGMIRAKADMVIAELIEGGISGWYMMSVIRATPLGGGFGFPRILSLYPSSLP